MMPTKSGWVIEYATEAVRKEVRKLPESVREDFDAVCWVIENDGPLEVSSHHIKQLKGPGKLLELRLQGDKMISRAIYVTRMEKRFVILVVFIKKSQGIPKHILKLARKRAREV